MRDRTKGTLKTPVLLWEKKYSCRAELFLAQRKNRGFCVGTQNLDSTLKITLFIVETDSISVKYICMLKTMKGVYVR